MGNIYNRVNNKKNTTNLYLLIPSLSIFIPLQSSTGVCGLQKAYLAFVTEGDELLTKRTINIHKVLTLVQKHC